ncbi:MAG: gluconolactonase, partial [Acidimicrobiales bacterium]|nr:gluconolactonase [Acidimicrobiales bacterium]
FGFDIYEFLAEEGMAALVEPPGPPTANIIMVSPDGIAREVADELFFPNGMVITPDGKTFIVAETLAMRLTAFDIEPDGSLSNRRVWANLAHTYIAPDGICMNEDGDIWVSNAIGPDCVLVAEGGKVVQHVRTPDACFACMLGGPDRRDLYMLCAPTSVAYMEHATNAGSIYTLKVEVPGVGLP